MTVRELIFMVCLRAGGENNTPQYTWDNYRKCVAAMILCVDPKTATSPEAVSACLEKVSPENGWRTK